MDYQADLLIASWGYMHSAVDLQTFVVNQADEKLVNRMIKTHFGRFVIDSEEIIQALKDAKPTLK